MTEREAPSGSPFDEPLGLFLDRAYRQKLVGQAGCRRRKSPVKSRGSDREAGGLATDGGMDALGTVDRPRDDDGFGNGATDGPDQIGDIDVLTHALRATEARDGLRYDIIVMLQPTSPLRTPAHVSATIRMLVEGGWDSVWTVSLTDTKAHPLKQLTVSDAGALDYYDPRGVAILARQQLEPVYHRNGIAYAISRDCLLTQASIKGKRAGALVIEGDHVSIDTEWDLTLVDFILTHRPA